MFFSRIINVSLFLLCTHFVYGQCPEGEVKLSTQNGLDLFSAKYPNCTELSSDLTIDGNYIYDWERLPDFISVAGSFSISNINEKKGIDKIIGNLVFIGKDIILKNISEEVTQGEFLKNQDVINGSLKFYRCSFGAWDFQNVKIIKDDFHIVECHDLQNLDQFHNLESSANISISYNESLNSIEGLNSLVDPFSSIEIYHNPLLTSCDLPIICEAIAKDSSIYLSSNGGGSCDNITALHQNCGVKFNACKELTVVLESQEDVDSFNFNYKLCLDSIKTLRIYEGVSNLDSLYKLTVVDELYISNASIKNLEGLNSLSSLRSLMIFRSENLISLNGLENARGIEHLQIYFCPVLEDMQSLNFEGANINKIDLKSLPLLSESTINCDSVLSEALLSDVSQGAVDLISSIPFINILKIERSPLVENVDIVLKNKINRIAIGYCNNIEAINIGSVNTKIDRISCFQNENLQRIQGLHAMERINSLSISGNPLLENVNFSNLHCLENIGISGNAILETINIQEVDTIKNLYFYQNESLTDISFLENIANQLLILNITFNPKLEICNYEPICDFIASHKSNETVYIGSNGAGCNLNDLPCNFDGNIYTKVRIETQEDVDNLAQQYPNADSIFGEVLIRKFNGDLSYFEQINYIDTTLEIEYSSASLEPFKNCHMRDLALYRYSGIDLPLFNGIEVMRSLRLTFCYQPDILQAFSKVEKVTSYLSLTGLSSIQSLEDLHDSIKLRSLNLSRLDIKNFEGIHHLKELNSFNINGLDSINNFFELDQLTQIERFDVEYCDNLTDLFQTEQIEGINRLVIENNSALQNISGFENIRDLANIQIHRNNEIENINNFPN